MAESVATGYQRLFEIQALHHYWLDHGPTVYDLINPPERKARHLQNYDRRAFLAITPTAATVKFLKGFSGVYKDTALGGVAAVPKTAVLPVDATLEFLLTVQSAAFYSYTALTLPQQRIYQLRDAATATTYRYKENVHVLSNLTGAARGAGAGKQLFLSREFRARTADDRVEALIIENNDLLQLTGDPPPVATRRLGPAAGLPVFVNQHDVPTLVPPPGISGVPQRGIELSQEMADDVYAVVPLSARRPDDDAFSFLDANGKAKTPAPIFQIRFKNRATLWKYFDQSTRAFKSSEAAPFPLTYFGNAGGKQKASPDTVKTVTDGARIDQLTSEIFI